MLSGVFLLTCLAGDWLAGLGHRRQKGQKGARLGVCPDIGAETLACRIGPSLAEGGKWAGLCGDGIVV